MLTASDKIELVLRHVYGDVAAVCAELGVDYVVIGAAARDLVLHHVYEAPILRATSDIDFGLNVRDWDSFYQLRDALVARGYRASSSQHRLFSPDDATLDLVSFGPVADADFNIAWPPTGETKMSVLGFDEASRHSDLIRIQDDPQIDVRVATPIGMSLLKTIAWKHRSADVRTKDAKDLLYLLANYSKIPEVLEAIYRDSALGERHEWDVDLMSAQLLGRRAGEIASLETTAAILSMADHVDSIDSLVWEASDGADHIMERSRALVTAFLEGFRTSI